MDSPKRQGIEAARALLAAGGTASLAVRDVAGAGAPFVTLVNMAADSALCPIVLISGLAHHTKCLTADPQASLLLHASLPTEGDPLLALRVTLSGVFHQADDPEAGRVFLARHPYAELYAGLGDFRFWRMRPDHAHIIAGFGRAYGVRFSDLAGAG